MRQSLKIAISLLASLLLFAGFAVLAFSGLFNVLQASFFKPGIQKAYQGNLESLAAGINGFHASNVTMFDAVAKKDYVAASFAIALSNETLRAWSDAQTQLGILGVRLLGADGKRILFSSFTKIDVKDQTADRVAYKNYNEDGTWTPAADLLVAPGQQPKVLIDGGHQEFAYALPISAPAQASAPAQDGTLIFYVSPGDLLSQLALSGSGPVDRILLVGTGGILINFDFDPADSKTVQDELLAIYESNARASTFVAPLFLTSAEGGRTGFQLFSTRLSAGGFASIVVPNPKL